MAGSEGRIVRSAVDIRSCAVVSVFGGLVAIMSKQVCFIVFY